jgi:GT2 family glycosyltransferase
LETKAINLAQNISFALNYWQQVDSLNRISVIVFGSGKTDVQKQNRKIIESICAKEQIYYADDSRIETFNRLANASKCEFLCFLSDAVEVNRECLEAVVRVFDQYPRIGLLQPKMVQVANPNVFSQVGGSGGFTDKLGYTYVRDGAFGEPQLDIGRYDNGQSFITWAASEALFVRKSVFGSACGFDETLPLHYSAIDFSMRVQRLGFRVALCSESSVGVHDKMALVQNESIFHRLLLLSRHQENAFILMLLFHGIIDLFRLIGSLFIFRFRRSGNILKAYANVIANLPDWLHQRSQMITTLGATRAIYRKPVSIYWQYYAKLGKTASNALAIFLVIASVFSLTMRDRR